MTPTAEPEKCSFPVSGKDCVEEKLTDGGTETGGERLQRSLLRSLVPGLLLCSKQPVQTLLFALSRSLSKRPKRFGTT